MATAEFTLALLGLCAFSIDPCPQSGPVPNAEFKEVTVVFPRGGSWSKRHYPEIVVDESDVFGARPRGSTRVVERDGTSTLVWRVEGPLKINYQLEGSDISQPLQVSSLVGFDYVVDLPTAVAKTKDGLRHIAKKSDDSRVKATLLLPRESTVGRPLIAEQENNCVWKFSKDHEQQIAARAHMSILKTEKVIVTFGGKELTLIDQGGLAGDEKVAVILRNFPDDHPHGDPYKLEHFPLYLGLSEVKLDELDKSALDAPTCNSGTMPKSFFHAKPVSCVICQGCN